ncbi:DUF4959 domain-containing protein [Labilibaculum sp. A4]|uniref:discoidin domain-containing protein n=1 Tax=Labilibaculum euxinus TaxID=2686357 RepID=UPI000F61EE17|nr:discoidin domain-containing protein [Labilibaculum euxinus]MDQ1769270.1 discoidin domain-containing protein [Labilibaculum euxinus]MWN74794.1 DUF4959 domain-containing protein [Labilibaculum euxinus]
MKQQSFIYATILLAAVFFSSCDKKFEVFEDTVDGNDLPTNVESVTSEALPGQILLKWDVPLDSNYYYLQMSYYDHLTEKKVFEVISVYADSILIDNTRAKYGDYEFAFQAFNKNGQGSGKINVVAKSGIAPATETITATKIELEASQLSTNNQEPKEGPIANLIDGNSSSFFHTRWSSPQIPMPQYIQIDLNEPIDDFQFYLVNREWSQQAPKIVEIQISNDGVNWETVKTISSGLPSAGGADYTSEIFRPGRTFSHFRYNCLETFNNRNYFNLAEFVLYDVDIDTYDPEL